MMRHLLTHPAFPDIVAEWAESEARAAAAPGGWANDNEAERDDLSDPLLALVATAEIQATRLW
jgi:hypothetical protein